MNEMQFDNAMWWIDTMAIQTVKQYHRWMNQQAPMEQDEMWEMMMGRMNEIVATINLIARSRFGTEETKQKIGKTINWLNGQLKKHGIRINLRG